MGLDPGHEVRDVAMVLSASGDGFEHDRTFNSSSQEALDVATSHPAKRLVIELDGVTYSGGAGLNAVRACYERGASDAVAGD